MEISQYRVRQCSKCSGDLEFVCIICEFHLCQRCKENHLTDLSTKNHVFKLYCEKNNYHLQERCKKHPRMVVEKYCQTCRIPFCLFCREHRKHSQIDIRTAYEQERKQNGGTINMIKNEIIFEKQVMLKGIKTDIETCHANIPDYQSLMYKKAQKLKRILDNGIKSSLFVHRCLKQKFKLNAHLVWIKWVETKYEKSSYIPIHFLKNIKKINLPRTQGGSYFTYHSRQQLTTGSFKIDNLFELQNKVEITEKGERCVTNDRLLKFMSSPLLQTLFLRTDPAFNFPSSLMTSNLLEDRDGEPDFNSMNKLRETLKRLKDDLLQSCELRSNNIWLPNCLHCSPFTGDVLVGMQQLFNWKPMIRSRIDRYDYTGKIKNKGPVRFFDSVFVAENNNGDIVVSDRSIVLVTDHEGN